MLVDQYEYISALFLNLSQHRCVGLLLGLSTNYQHRLNIVGLHEMMDFNLVSFEGGHDSWQSVTFNREE
jgi:hypothetical protein